MKGIFYFFTFCDISYCTNYIRNGRSETKWLGELDTQPDNTGDGPYDLFKTLSACEELEYADYTGSQCCGDDPHEYYSEYSDDYYNKYTYHNG